MYLKEIDALLSDLHVDNEWRRKAPQIIGFLVEGDYVEALMKRPKHKPVEAPIEEAGDKYKEPLEDRTSRAAQFVERGFLALGCAEEYGQAPPTYGRYKDPCEIGLSLAYAFPRTVRGELTALVKWKDRPYLLSVNHVVWMNGWANPKSKIVSRPFSNPPFTKVGCVSEMNFPLRGCFYVNTLEELALAEAVSSGDLPEPALPLPSECRLGEKIYRLDCYGRLREGRVLCTDFRLALRFEYGRFLFKEQILIEGHSTPGYDCDTETSSPFAARGDSGSLLFQKTYEGEYVPVAALWAGSPDYEPGSDLYVAVPLLPYFKQRELEFLYYRNPRRERPAAQPH